MADDHRRIEPSWQATRRPGPMWIFKYPMWIIGT
jgi:hypothetical protein